MELYLVRHADAVEPGAWPGPDDERPLTTLGEDQAARLARHLAALAVRPAVVVTSPRARARRTAEILARTLGADARPDERLAGRVGIGTVDAILDELGDLDPVVLVGHDPDLSELLTALVGAPGLALRKGALARLEVGRPLGPGQATLRWLLPPDAIPGDRAG